MTQARASRVGWLTAVLTLLVGAMQAQAAEAPTAANVTDASADKPADGAIVVVPTVANSQTARAIVGAFHAALRDNWQQGVLDLLAPDVAIFEQGYTESSRDAYASGHLQNDLIFAQTTQYDVVHRESYASGDMAWVITQARTTGTFAGEKVDIDNTETMVLERRQGKWQIVHIHWSAHPRTP